MLTRAATCGVLWALGLASMAPAATVSYHYAGAVFATVNAPGNAAGGAAAAFNTGRLVIDTDLVAGGTLANAVLTRRAAYTEFGDPIFDAGGNPVILQTPGLVDLGFGLPDRDAFDAMPSLAYRLEFDADARLARWWISFEEGDPYRVASLYENTWNGFQGRESYATGLDSYAVPEIYRMLDYLDTRADRRQLMPYFFRADCLADGALVCDAFYALNDTLFVTEFSADTPGQWFGNLEDFEGQVATNAALALLDPPLSPRDAVWTRFQADWQAQQNQPAPVPAPPAAALLLAGLTGLGWLGSRRA